MRTGILDTGKFPEAAIVVSNIYEQRHKVKSNELAIGVLIDEFGSMYGPKIEAARKCAILFNEAFNKSPWVELFVYGYSADRLLCNSTDMYIYKESKHNPKCAIGSVQAKSMNRDGTAIFQTP